MVIDINDNERKMIDKLIDIAILYSNIDLSDEEMKIIDKISNKLYK